MPGNILANRRGFVPLPVVCISKKKIWVQDPEYWGIPNRILCLFWTEQLYDEDPDFLNFRTFWINRYPPEYIWTGRIDIFPGSSHLTAELSFIDGSFSISGRFPFWVYENGYYLRGPVKIAANFLKIQQGAIDVVSEIGNSQWHKQFETLAGAALNPWGTGVGFVALQCFP